MQEKTQRPRETRTVDGRTARRLQAVAFDAGEPLPPGGSIGTTAAPRGRPEASSLTRSPVIDDLLRSFHRLKGEIDATTKRIAASSHASEPPIPGRSLRYSELRLHVACVVRRIVPAGSIVTVAAHGDDRLLEFDRCVGWHFPGSAEGRYLGHHPGTGAEAIALLHAQRERGAAFIVFPCTMFWWLDHYRAFRRHLNGGSARVWSDERCIVYRLD